MTLQIEASRGREMIKKGEAETLFEFVSLQAVSN